MTALTIIQDVARELSIEVPGAAFSSTATEVIQLRGLLNREGRALARRHNWQEIVIETSFTTVAQNQQTAIPSDFDRIVGNSMWNRTQDRAVQGPLTAQAWQQEKSGGTYTINNLAYRIRGGSLLLTPVPTAGESVYYEYVSKNWAETSGGTGLAAMTADTDVARLDEDLLTLGVIWRYLHANGLDYAEPFRTYEMQVEQAIARDGGSTVLNLSHGMPRERVFPNIKEGSWP